ncbi:MAG TPA: hypothetical protein PLF50_06535 [Candidatus Cloacimonadota bacterium]|nr:hypothetical protein [Candidatus Cloacimonadota bacterium]HOV17128.1 hypothetical protein [Candidatus Cloacimonadota bacterium]HQL15418.1 hypothetical protein [Candidatus Cloacimonadota bacterium]
MAKNNRGKQLRSLPNHGRGECPICHRTGVKLTYELKKDDQTLKVCKLCSKIQAKAAKA